MRVGGRHLYESVTVTVAVTMWRGGRENTGYEGHNNTSIGKSSELWK